jgi:hypothetical protein
MKHKRQIFSAIKNHDTLTQNTYFALFPSRINQLNFEKISVTYRTDGFFNIHVLNWSNSRHHRQNIYKFKKFNLQLLINTWSNKKLLTNWRINFDIAWIIFREGTKAFNWRNVIFLIFQQLKLKKIHTWKTQFPKTKVIVIIGNQSESSTIYNCSLIHDQTKYYLLIEESILTLPEWSSERERKRSIGGTLSSRSFNSSNLKKNTHMKNTIPKNKSNCDYWKSKFIINYIVLTLFIQLF